MKDRRLAVFIDRNTTHIRSIVAGTIGSSSALGNRRGVTLIEILVVISVITVITILAIPAISDYKTSADANRAITFILADMQLSRTGAIFTNKQYRITFKTTLNLDGVYWYEIKRKAYTAGASWEPVKENGLPAGIEYGLPIGILGPGNDVLPVDGIDFADNVIFFENTGGASTGAVYIMPFKDKAPLRADRMRAAGIEFGPTGKVKSYKYINPTFTVIDGWKAF
jgi:prepilin-type N-terminal cleavage/methylation domain-containing protein